uniref:ABC transporter domain-containing protein n=1 Tax=Parascaris equorum TaxID=6256 RepID=A0A914S4A1_PAREQ
LPPTEYIINESLSPKKNCYDVFFSNIFYCYILNRNFQTIKGAIQLKNVFFSYPTRRNTRILRGLTLNVKEGETVALVGHSGCGKSTVMGLLERFYDPNRGNIYVDGENIRDVNIKCLRSQMCIVSQEPILFDCTIEENIMYGLDREVSHEEVVNAAKLANIHKFILSLP